MKYSLLLEQAIHLRKSGWSYREISEQLSISKSTCSLWVKDVVLNKNAQKRLAFLKERGREKGSNTLKQKRADQYNGIRGKALNVLGSIHFDIYIKKIICAMLYWGEGEKNLARISFTNSDPELIGLFVKLFIESFSVDPSKFTAVLHLHEYHDRAKQLQFWSKVTKIPQSKIGVYLKPHSAKTIRDNYPGCIAIRYHDVRVYKELEFLYKLVVQQQGSFVQW